MGFVGYKKTTFLSEIIPIRFPHVKFLQGKPTIITEFKVSIMLTKTNQIFVPNFRGIMLIQHND